MIKMSRRRLHFRTARAVGRPRSLDWYLVRDGKVDTGSEWDNQDIRDVYRTLLGMCKTARAAHDLTRAIWENRVHALREQQRNGRAAEILDACDEQLISIEQTADAMRALDEALPLEPDKSQGIMFKRGER